MEFEWDAAKDTQNLAKHGISFVAAAQIRESGTALVFQSSRGEEARWVATGRHPTTQTILAVVYTTREHRHRIISARRARKNEEEEYQQHIGRKASKPGAGTEAGPDDER
ncbi:hypothetical protein BH23GEM1_BH23GEM1_11230 [soil metagenome]